LIDVYGRAAASIYLALGHLQCSTGWFCEIAEEIANRTTFNLFRAGCPIIINNLARA